MNDPAHVQSLLQQARAIVDNGRLMLFFGADMDKTLKAGSLFMVERGDLRDVLIDGPLRVLKDFVKGDAARAFTAATADAFGKVNGYDFMPWLIAEGYVEAVECHRWYVGLGVSE